MEHEPHLCRRWWLKGYPCPYTGVRVFPESQDDDEERKKPGQVPRFPIPIEDPRAKLAPGRGKIQGGYVPPNFPIPVQSDPFPDLGRLMPGGAPRLEDGTHLLPEPAFAAPVPTSRGSAEAPWAPSFEEQFVQEAAVSLQAGSAANETFRAPQMADIPGMDPRNYGLPIPISGQFAEAGARVPAGSQFWENVIAGQPFYTPVKANKPAQAPLAQPLVPTVGAQAKTAQTSAESLAASAGILSGAKNIAVPRPVQTVLARPQPTSAEAAHSSQSWIAQAIIGSVAAAATAGAVAFLSSDNPIGPGSGVGARIERAIVNALPARQGARAAPATGVLGTGKAKGGYGGFFFDFWESIVGEGAF